MSNLEHAPIPASVPAEFPEILRELSRAILKNQPTDIISFCADYFQKKKLEGNTVKPTYNTVGESDSMQPGTTLDGDAAEPISMSADAPAAVVVGEAEKETEHEPLSDDDEEDYEEAAPMPVIQNNHNRGRRTSVSAESMAPSSEEEYVKVNIPKTEEQRGRIQKAIRANFLFKAIDDEQFADVVNAMAEKLVAAGETVITQGGIGDYFYVVETGALDVFVSRNGAAPVKVTDYGANGSFGELALMYNAPRAATVTATEASVLWALDRVTFRRILMENTSKKRRMYERLLEELPLLTSLEPYERHKIADALEPVTFNEGDVVIKQGDAGDAFYIIEAGDAVVTQTDSNGEEHVMMSLKKGSYFGELALLTDKPRKATITAKTKLKCAFLGKKAFNRLLGPCVDIIKRNAANYETLYQKIELD